MWERESLCVLIKECERVVCVCVCVCVREREIVSLIEAFKNMEVIPS